MYNLPTTVTINNKQFNITNRGDFRMVLDCFIALNDPELEEEERIFACLCMFYEGINGVEDFIKFGNQETAISDAADAMYDFFNCNQKNIPMTTQHKVIDWEQDEQIIMAGVNNIAGTEVRALPYCHWFTFMGYFMSIGQSVLSEVVEIRSKLLKGKKLEDSEKEFKKENPEYFIWNSKTPEEAREEQEILDVWNKNSEETVIV